jgi:hypothetical protein
LKISDTETFTSDQLITKISTIDNKDLVKVLSQSLNQSMDKDVKLQGSDVKKLIDEFVNAITSIILNDYDKTLTKSLLSIVLILVIN